MYYYMAFPYMIFSYVFMLFPWHSVFYAPYGGVSDVCKSTTVKTIMSFVLLYI